MLAPYFRQSGPFINLCRRVWFEKGKIYRENRGQSPRVPASRGSNLFPHCGAADPSLLPLDTVSRVSSSAGNSTPVSLPHRSTEASCSTPAPNISARRSSLVLIAVLFNRASSGGHSVGDISNEGRRGHCQRGATDSLLELPFGLIQTILLTCLSAK